MSAVTSSLAGSYKLSCQTFHNKFLKLLILPVFTPISIKPIYFIKIYIISCLAVIRICKLLGFLFVNWSNLFFYSFSSSNLGFAWLSLFFICKMRDKWEKKCGTCTSVCKNNNWTLVWHVCMHQQLPLWKSRKWKHGS